MTQSFVPVASLLAVLGVLLHGASSFPFKSAGSLDESSRRLVDDLLDARVDGSRNSMHAFREDIIGLDSHPDFLKGNRASSSELHEIVMVIKEKNLDELTRILHDISDPLSANYGNHMTYKEIDELVSNPVAHQEVVNYLTAAGATVLFAESQGECITARADIGTWERMLNTEFHSYHKVSSVLDSQWPADAKTEFFRADKYSIPSVLDDHVAYVFGTIQTPELRFQKGYLDGVRKIATPKEVSKFSVQKTIAGFCSPELMWKRYNIDDISGHPQATQGAFELAEQVFCPEDLRSFQELYELPITPAAGVVQEKTRTAAQCKNNPLCVESNADMMYMLAMCNTPTYHYYTYFNSFGLWAQNIANSGVMPPLVISVSYGNDESLYSESEYNLFQTSVIKMGAMGCTITIAAGDDGVHKGVARSNANLCGYKAQYPTSCPYVISVGATQVLSLHLPHQYELLCSEQLTDNSLTMSYQQGIEKGLPEVVCSNDRGGGITSGGGFAANYPQPEWQKAAVAQYFATVAGTSKEPFPGYATGRGYPDITAAGADLIMVAGGGLVGAAGTSLSAPIAGGILSLVNAARFKAGGKPIGFVTPILYQYSSQFMNDVTVGKNNCTALSVCCKQGFAAAPGWDPASGLGSIDFKRFRDFMLNVANLPKPASPVSAPTGKPFSPPVQLISPVPPPTGKPVSPPTAKPVSPPTEKPVSPPTGKPVSPPTEKPVSPPTGKPVSPPTEKPVSPPTGKPVAAPVAAPVSPPTGKPVTAPVANQPSAPAAAPTAPISPTANPTAERTTKPTTVVFQGTFTANPSSLPTAIPSTPPSFKPTPIPSGSPVPPPTATPSEKPSVVTVTNKPSTKPVKASLPPNLCPTRRPRRKRTSKPSTYKPSRVAPLVKKTEPSPVVAQKPRCPATRQERSLSVHTLKEKK
jgi:tripeptidyl-peptidase I